ncbi:adenylate/guanylate cyclase domain-containing protein [Accumulibacter sp.]|uniref:CHASE2 domain-containing protein n=1 Tax=Accumulibacter sp. TaxID=2053492 RepID=UPI002B56A28F|nr:adenylate/guanylate cyclase domain-containing protein [Accumulibacter sp.]HRF03321.1 adenylate/guanylate cyclase domain-containing protein [Accumulibacter sp.]
MKVAHATHSKRLGEVRRRLTAIILRYLPGVLLLAVLLAQSLHYLEIAPLQRLEAVLYDARVRFFAQAPIDERIVIVDIDERSLAELGRWPWSRARLAELVERIFADYGALLLGLDVILAEADESSGLASLQALASGALRGNAGFLAALEDLRPSLDYDARLADAIRRYPVILGFHLSSGAAAASSGALPTPVLSDLAPGTLASLGSWTGYGGNLPALQEAAMGAGFLNAPVDGDGVTRRAWLLASVQGRVYPALALAMAQVLIGNARLQLQFSAPPPWLAGGGKGTAIEALELLGARGTLRIASDSHARVLLPFRGREGSFAYYSAADVLAARLPDERLRGRVVLLGTTAPGLLDQRVTPLGEAYPGVEAHANLLSAMLDGRLLQSPAWTPVAAAGLLLIVGSGLLLALPRLSPLSAAGVALATLLLVVLGNLAVWAFAQLLLPIAGLLVLVLGLFALQLFVGYFLEQRGKRRLARLFGQYVPPELVEEMSRDPQHYSMAGRSAELTVLFADVRGFTTLAESMPPGELAQLMNDYLSAVTDVIRAHRGTLDKYIGDAVVAFWGAPVADPQHARHAVMAGLAMQAALQRVNQDFVARGWPALQIGIGINTGSMVVGDMGSRHRRAYTVLGDAVNLASRLQGLSAQYGAGVIIGEATRQALGDWPCRQLDEVTVRGRKAPVAIHEALAG